MYFFAKINNSYLSVKFFKNSFIFLNYRNSYLHKRMYTDATNKEKMFCFISEESKLCYFCLYVDKECFIILRVGNDVMK